MYNVQCTMNNYLEVLIIRIDLVGFIETIDDESKYDCQDYDANDDE